MRKNTEVNVEHAHTSVKQRRDQWRHAKKYGSKRHSCVHFRKAEKKSMSSGREITEVNAILASASVKQRRRSEAAGSCFLAAEPLSKSFIK